MSHESISCPYCGKSIQLSKAISQEVDARLESELEARERILNKKHDVELQKARKEASVTAAAELSLEIEILKGQVAESTSRLKHTQQLEIKLRRERQNVEAEKAELELRVDREIDERRKEIEASTLKRVSESQNLIIREKDQLLDQMKRQIEQLKQKAEQGSQQLQGEVLELDLEQKLRTMFPFDSLKPIPKGVIGADLLQEVLDRSGELCGSILWETKRTKRWSETWLEKLKADQLAAQAEVALLLTQMLPKNCERFQQIDGSLWVTNYECAFDLASVLRNALIELARTRRAVRGKNEKIEILYDYLSSSQFGTRVESILKSLILMKSDLDAEKRTYSRIWAKRQAQIEGVIGSVSHVVGDLQAVGDLTFDEIKSLDFPENVEVDPSLTLQGVSMGIETREL